MSVSLAGHTVEQIRAFTLEEAGGVLITASERARMWMYGVRDGSDESLNPSEDMMKVIEELARAGPRGMLQNQLTKAVKIPANKLAYTLSVLEMDHVIEREAVWISTASLRADPAAATIPPPPPSFNKYVNPILKTNLVTLLALRPDIPMAPLTAYKGHSHGDGGLLERMVQLLAASPHGLLPFFKLRIDLGIATREDKGVWNRLKERALQDGLIEEVSFTVGGASFTVGGAAAGAAAGALGGAAGAVPDASGYRPRAVRRGIRLVRRTRPDSVDGSGEASSSSSAPPALLDHAPLLQMQSHLELARSAGMLGVSFKEKLLLHPKHVTKRIVDLVDAHGVLRRSEQLGRKVNSVDIPFYERDSLTSGIGDKLPRKYFGVNAQARWDHGWGNTQVRVEFWQGTQTASRYSSERPGTPQFLPDGSADENFVRDFNGAFILFLQDLGSKRHQLGIKLDWYDPNRRVSGLQIGSGSTNLTAADVRYTTLGGGYLFYPNDNLKLTLWYDHIRNEQTGLTGLKDDLHDDFFTARVQFRF